MYYCKMSLNANHQHNPKLVSSCVSGKGSVFIFNTDIPFFVRYLRIYQFLEVLDLNIIHILAFLC